jgi:hypothetical protein
MKTKFINILLPVILCAFMAVSNYAFADPPPPPPPGTHGDTGNKGPMGGPIAGGVVVFLVFGASLAGWEIYKARKRKKSEEPVVNG